MRLHNAMDTLLWECVYSLVFLLLPLKAPGACFRGDQRQVTSVQGTHTTMLIRSAGAWDAVWRTL